MSTGRNSDGGRAHRFFRLCLFIGIALSGIAPARATIIDTREYVQFYCDPADIPCIDSIFSRIESEIYGPVRDGHAAIAREVSHLPIFPVSGGRWRFAYMNDPGHCRTINAYQSDMDVRGRQLDRLWSRANKQYEVTNEWVRWAYDELIRRQDWKRSQELSRLYSRHDKLIGPLLAPVGDLSGYIRTAIDFCEERAEKEICSWQTIAGFGAEGAKCYCGGRQADPSRCATR